MFSSVWNFLRRHKRKFIYTGAVVGGIVLLGKYAKKRLLEYQDHEAEECLTHARKQHHFDSNQRTCNMTVLSIVPKLRKSILQLLDSETLTAELKNRPSNKMDIWEELKYISFGRTLLCIYSCCLLIVFLRVQLNIVAGYMYLETMLNVDVENSELVKATPEVQHKYLGLVQYVLDTGVEVLSEDIQKIVRNQLESTSLKHQMSLGDIQHIFSCVRSHMEGMHGNGYVSDNTAFTKYILPPDDVPVELSHTLTPTERTLQQMKTETRDIIESSDFHTVLTGCLDEGFTQVIDRLGEYFKPTEGESTDSSQSIALPLAKIIPIMNGLISSILGDPPNSIVQDLLLKDQVKDFAANIYEAFSHPAEEHIHA